MYVCAGRCAAAVVAGRSTESLDVTMGIADAIRNRRLIRFSYDGYLRTVEPHAYGTDRKNRYLLRGYQVAGGSESGEYVGWKLFCEDEMVALTVTNDSFQGPRVDYKRGDRAMDHIIAEL